MKTLSGWIAALLLAAVLGHSPARGGELFIVSTGGTAGTIDTSNFAYTPVGSLGSAAPSPATGWWGGITYDASNDIIFGLDGDATTNLYSIDRGTGQASVIGSHGVSGLRGIAHDSTSNVLYGSDFTGPNPAFVTLNPQNGSSTPVGTITGTPAIGALAYDSTRDVLVGWYEFSGDIFEVDPATGEAVRTLLDGPDTRASLGDLTYDPDLDLFWGVDIEGGWLFSIDPANGYARTNRLNLQGLVDLQNLPVLSGLPIGIAFINSIASNPNDPNSPAPLHSPEPTSLAAFGVAALALGLARARSRKRARRETLEC